MKFEQKATIPAPIDQVWSFLMDVPRVAVCAPGVETVEPIGDDKYRGTLKIAMGPVRFALTGDVSIVERDETTHAATMLAEASDRRAGGAVKATMRMALSEVAGTPASTELHIDTDALLMGKSFEFGQPIIRKKADQIMTEFAKNIAQALTQPTA
ncbi:MAG: uncharacterized protein QOF51_843 [Chloroflexota bacterium]|jgi:carbon monoxide dehydrogenase subunit G|nr:uncharacterized protein [Nocardioidaceae bacterium]MEA2639449.1 uncharacterized protein [Chloroflexota bacterium]